MSERPSFISGVPAKSTEPRKAPRNFRELPPCEEQPIDRRTDEMRTVYIGSGVAFADHPLAKDWYRRCAGCGSDDTLCLYAEHTRKFGHVDTWVWTDCEYLCRRCGSFTFYETYDEY